jgi:signal transduction histidine kinase
MPVSRSKRLPLRLALASLGWAAALAVVCGVGLVSLRRIAAVTQAALGQQIAMLNDAAAFQALLYQKGFVAEYMLTRDHTWLDQLERSRGAFRAWMGRAHAGSTSPEAARLLERIEGEYAAYDDGRNQVLAAFDSGDRDRAIAMLRKNHGHTERLLGLFEEFGRLGRAQAERTLAAAASSTAWQGGLLVGTSIAGALASLAVGFLLARRLTRPIYELQLRVESAAQRRRIEVDPRRDDLDGLAEHVGALVRKLEDQDASLSEQRRRLLQSEKLSAMGELAAKLAHEILNPLAGMKVAVQVLARSGASSPSAAQATADALGREILRVEDLVHRLVDYARPLAPRVEVCSVSRLLDAAVEAARPELHRADVHLERREEPDLPPLEIDPLLMTQALANLLINAAQAMPQGGTIEVRARCLIEGGQHEVLIEIGDEGPGIAEADLPRLFHPFFTTREKGHGLGLAVSQNIALEHGGRIVARNRTAGRGAIFDLRIPLLR